MVALVVDLDSSYLIDPRRLAFSVSYILKVLFLLRGKFCSAFRILALSCLWLTLFKNGLYCLLFINSSYANLGSGLKPIWLKIVFRGILIKRLEPVFDLTYIFYLRILTISFSGEYTFALRFAEFGLLNL